MVETPVGARCQECAQIYTLPTYQISWSHYLKAVGVALVTAAICGAAWGAINWIIAAFSLNLILAPAVGYIIGTSISLSVNRKRGKGLVVIGGIAITGCYLLTFLFPGNLPISPFTILYHIFALGIGMAVIVYRLR